MWIVADKRFQSFLPLSKRSNSMNRHNEMRMMHGTV